MTVDPAAHRSLKVLLVVPHFFPQRTGGAEQIAYDTARWLIRHGHAVRVVYVERVEPNGPDRVESVADAHEDIPVLRLTVRSHSLADAPGLQAELPELTRFFERLLRDERPDVVHLLSGYLLGAPLLEAARDRGVPVIVTLLDFWFICPTLHLVRGDGTLCDGPEPLECARCLYDTKRRYQIPDRLAPAVMRQFWRAAQQAPAIGRRLRLFETLESIDARRKHFASLLSSARAITSRTSFVAERHRVNGIAGRPTIVMSPVADRRAERGLPDRATHLRFGYLGQLSPAKGVDLALSAFSGLNAPAGNISLSVNAAPNASARYIHRIERLARRDRRIRLSGRYDRGQLMNLLREMDVLVVPSTWHENAPLVIVEAFSAGVPVIGSDVGGISELVRHDINGLLFARGQVQDLRRQMQRLVDEPPLLQKLRNGIPRVRTLDEEMNDWLALYTSPA